MNSYAAENSGLGEEYGRRCRIAAIALGSIMASDPDKTAALIRFGEDFELDLRAYELRRASRVLRLERIPMELLLLLIQERGQLVTRDQIIERIWGKDVFLDTDNSINAAIRKIRQVLKDDPEQPRFVQTITGRGYRFIAAVVETNAAGLKSSATKGTKVSGALRPKLWKILVPVLVALAAALLSGVFHHRSRQGVKLTDKDAIVLADFTNTTGDPVFDGTLRQGLSARLEQSPFLNLLSDERIAQTLALMAQPKDARLTDTLASEVCKRTAAGATIEGSISRLGRPVCARVKGGQLPQRRFAGRGTGDGEWQGTGAQSAGRRSDKNARASGRVAGFSAAV
ncbi:MAG: winged helix-turn-helix domain-containing protein [Terriglobales bacterium]